MNDFFKDACTDAWWLCWLEAHPGLAAWAQLIGVLATLLVTLVSAWLPIWVRRAEHRRQQAALKISAADAAHSAAESLAAVADIMSGGYVGGVTRQMLLKKISEAKDAISEVPHQEIEDLAIKSALKQMENTIRGIDDFVSTIPDQRSSDDGLHEYIGRIAKSFAEDAKTWAAFIQEFGS